MNRPAVRLLGFLSIGALLAQAGHLLAYQLAFGAAAQDVQSQGVHSYFPALAKTSLGLLGAAVLVSLLLIGVARMAPGRQFVVTDPGLSYVRLLSVLFTAQVMCFIVQETLESLSAGTAVPSGLSLLLLGSAGQLPVAMIAALALRWVLIRLEVAFLTLRAEPAVTPAPAPVSLFASLPALAQVPALDATCPTVYIKRGPPAILRA